jgi:tyrosine-protein phosphatase YwqE
MVELGILFQVSARSILGENQLKRKGFCKAMLKNGAIFAIVSDSCEHLRHPPRLSRCYTYLKRHYDEQLASRLLFSQPNALLGHSANR